LVEALSCLEIGNSAGPTMKFLVALLASVKASRIDHSVASSLTQSNPFEGLAPACRCSDTGLIGSKDIGKKGCKMHFGQRFGFICYMDGGGSECEGAKLSNKLGVYYRTCPDERKANVAKLELLESMESMDNKEINRLMNRAEKLGVDAPTVKMAASRISTIAEMKALKKEVFEALKGFSHPRLLKAKKRANELELFEFLTSDVPSRIEGRLAFLLTKGTKEEVVKEMMAGVNNHALRDAIKAAIEVKANPAVVKEGQETLVKLEKRLAESKAALVAALKSFDVDAIATAIKDAEYYKHCRPSDVATAKERMEYLQIMTGNNMHSLKKAYTHWKVKAMYVDVQAKAEIRIKEVRAYNHNLKVSLKEMTATCESKDKNALNDKADEATDLKATSNADIAAAYACVAKLR